jgi:hypothetical protein
MRHHFDDAAELLEQAELAAIDVELASRVGAFEQSAEAAQRSVEVLQAGSELARLHELVENVAAERHGLGVGWRRRQHLHQVTREHGRLRTIEVNLKARRHELIQKQIVSVVGGVPRGAGDVGAREGVGKEPAGRSSREREGDRGVRRIDIDAAHRNRVQQIGDLRVVCG